jgi:hypothetical protein
MMRLAAVQLVWEVRPDLAPAMNVPPLVYNYPVPDATDPRIVALMEWAGERSREQMVAATADPDKMDPFALG